MNGRRHRAALAQNFFCDPAVVRAFVQDAGLCAGDRVYDLGAGTGAITREILRAGACAIAVERDPNLARKLRQRFAGEPVTIIEGDLLRTAFEAPYKVVANIPFNLTAATLRRLLFDAPHPREALIVLQREAAEKYAGALRRTAVSLMLGPSFDMRIVRAFAATDFVPRPHVEVVLLRIVQRPEPLIEAGERDRWRAFVTYALGRSKPDPRRTFRNVVSNLQWRRLSADLAIGPDTSLSELSLEQWLGIYRFVRRCAPPHKVRRAFAVTASASRPRGGSSAP